MNTQEKTLRDMQRKEIGSFLYNLTISELIGYIKDCKIRTGVNVHKANKTLLREVIRSAIIFKSQNKTFIDLVTKRITSMLEGNKRSLVKWEEFYKEFKIEPKDYKKCYDYTSRVKYIENLEKWLVEWNKIIQNNSSEHSQVIKQDFTM